jgi:DNA (cytosine-5)-methyltransferase 1
MKKIKINHLDLFSGIGGFHLGFERAGFEINSYFSEIDKHAINVYKNNFKNSNYVGSVTNVRGKQLPKIDAITFGSPCQDFSMAGKRSGMQGKRSSLITEAIRLIDECRPRFFVWENVKGTFSSNNGADFWGIMQAFANIGGYRLEWQLLNTKWFLPQNRERIYLVGYIANESGRQIFPITKGRQSFNELQRQKANTTQAVIAAMRGRNPLNASDRTTGSPTKQRLEINKNGTSNTITSVTKDNLVVNGVFYDTIPEIVKVRKHKIRRLTPIECERLQGFPDNWTQFGENGKIGDTQRYKMCGNAVTVDVVEAVAKNIIKCVY